MTVLCAGIGKALCYALHKKLDQKGHHLFRVFATARRCARDLGMASCMPCGRCNSRLTSHAAANRLEALQALREDGIEVAALDVTSANSIAACMAEVTAAAGAVHVLINNAGMLSSCCAPRKGLAAPLAGPRVEAGHAQACRRRRPSLSSPLSTSRM